MILLYMAIFLGILSCLLVVYTPKNIIFLAKFQGIIFKLCDCRRSV